MEWVATWRQLKKLGALSAEGGGWLLPKTEELTADLANLVRSVEEMGGTANLYIATHFSESQEARAIGRFRKEREREYAGVITECRKALKHIEKEDRREEYTFDEVEELEGDIEKIRRWYADVLARDHWDTPAGVQVQGAIAEIEASLAGFTQKVYDRTAHPAGEA
jgi:hypothetical protein